MRKETKVNSKGNDNMRRISKHIYLLLGIAIVAVGARASVKAAPGDLFASVDGGFGAGFVGSVYQYTPDGAQSTFVSDLLHPRGLAFDSKGNFFLASNICAGSNCEGTRPAVLKVTPDGAQSVFATLPVSFTPEGLAIDRLDNVFVVALKPFSLSMIYKIAPNGVGSPFAYLNTYPGTQAFGLAFDCAGNLFVADAVANTIYKFTPSRRRSIVVGPEAFGSLGGPIGLAFDRSGNLFVSTNDFSDNGQILEFTSQGVETTFATGLIDPRGLAFDHAGNLFVTENPAYGTGDILKFAPDGTSSVFAAGIGDPTVVYSGPEFLAVEPRIR